MTAAAAAAVEARTAVWGEGGWPYGASVRTVDLAEELGRVRCCRDGVLQVREGAERHPARALSGCVWLRGVYVDGAMT